jgi:hypothetical protein
MTRRSDLELRVQTLEQMLEITMTTLLKMASAEQKQTLQKLLADVGRAEFNSPELAHECRRFVAGVAVRWGNLANDTAQGHHASEVSGSSHVP